MIAEGSGWKVMLGDSIERIEEIVDESVGLAVFSPPFPGMYAYTDSPRDVGNSKNLDELVEHFSYLIPDLYRVMMPGRSCAIHLTQQVAFKGTDGFTGLRDFRGRVIAAMEAEGWIYYGEVCIEKDPQLKAVRTKDHGLMFKSLATDAAKMHMALADYVLQFRKPGDNPSPIRAGISEKYENPGGWITNDEWIEWASPVWHRASKAYPGGIRESNVLNVSAARCEEDERHLCPLQLDVIERCVKLWSNPGDLIFDPFAGVGSTGHEALKWGRRFIGIELKESYFKQAAKNLRGAEALAAGGSLFEVATP
jgi:DNA modification methylase